MYYALVVWFFFLSLSGAAIILGPPESSPHVVAGSAVVFVASTAGLIVSAWLAMRHRAAKRDAVASGMPRNTARPAGPADERRQIEGGNN